MRELRTISLNAELIKLLDEIVQRKNQNQFIENLIIKDFNEMYLDILKKLQKRIDEKEISENEANIPLNRIGARIEQLNQISQQIDRDYDEIKNIMKTRIFELVI